MYNYKILSYFLFSYASTETYITKHMIENNKELFLDEVKYLEGYTCDLQEVENQFSQLSRELCDIYYKIIASTNNCDSSLALFCLKDVNLFCENLNKIAEKLIVIIKYIIKSKWNLLFPEVETRGILTIFIKNFKFDINTLDLFEDRAYYLLVFFKFLIRIKNREILVKELESFIITKAEIIELFL
ncbi:hypothetical protein H312_01913 [Anncaliia algerae PRA339]|uniref:Uncharacterized protein n=1 Tax=Anncaliia algerae PRA339 TaxID=1288291 RepID=A0A059F0N1_9MICR|nr:hypothetical protein H312_01913 [Anncaliia algerae PRA339]